MEVLTRRKANYNERDDGLNLLQQNSQYLESLIMRPQNIKKCSHMEDQRVLKNMCKNNFTPTALFLVLTLFCF